jgi:predicted AlkP superfamily pyrophosphatase or phosphodiesterase
MVDEMLAVDKALGEFLDSLREYGIRNQTNVIIVADHGNATIMKI